MKCTIIFAEHEGDATEAPIKEYNETPLIPAVGDDVKLFGSQIDGKVIERRFIYNPDEVRVVLIVKMTYGDSF